MESSLRVLARPAWLGGFREGAAQLSQFHHSKIAPVAQLDRASDFGSEGWGFESLRARFASRRVFVLSRI